jgi:hypothetical protein
MPEGRPDIPRELERALFMEAGHRCAIPTCRAVAPLVIEHIDDWAMVQEHKFENMIVLCANCHGLKGEGSRKLDRKALRQYKLNLGVINNRYSDFERRVLEYFAENPRAWQMDLPTGLDMLVLYPNQRWAACRDTPRKGYFLGCKVDTQRLCSYACRSRIRQEFRCSKAGFK